MPGKIGSYLFLNPHLSSNLLHVFIDRFNKELKKNVKGFTPEVLNTLKNHNWAGNVRELENVIERAIILCPGEIITVSDLPKDFKDNVYDTRYLEGIPANAKLHETLNKIEKKLNLKTPDFIVFIFNYSIH